MKSTLFYSAFLALLFSTAFNCLSAQQPIWGYADLHNHQFGNLAFGGRVIHGSAYGPIDQALPWCTSLHGAGGVLDLVGNTHPISLGHPVGGYPLFDGWPRWNSITHQQVYEDWLLRAHQGGLQLIVMLAVNNELLCKLNGGGTCDDMTMIDRQIQAAKDMEAYIDNKSGGPGKGWYRIVYTPQQAREAIAKGQLAVVLGVEVDNLFNCKTTACTELSVSDGLKALYEKGVRHVFPIHLYDNAFGGAAYYSEVMQNNLIQSNISKRDCSGEGYEYPCNNLGLTDLGKSFMLELVKRGMVIDIDHMSARAKNDAFSIAGQFNYPLVSGHTGFVEISKGARKHEGNLLASDVERIRILGGIIAPILHQGSPAETNAWGDKIPHECGNTSQSFAQAYLYVKEKMMGAPVALGSDFNGLAGNIQPRFGPDGCPANTKPEVSYPFNPRFNTSITMGKNQAGEKIFDINNDGVPHVGLLPDMMAELEAMGLSAQDLEPMFRSAEGYIKVWEKAIAKSPGTNYGPPLSSLPGKPWIGGGTFYLKPPLSTDKWLSHGGAAFGLYYANRTTADAWEKISVIPTGVPGIYYLKSEDGKFLSARPDGAVWKAQQPQELEKWGIVDGAYKGIYSLTQNRWLSADKVLDGRIGTAPLYRDWEKWDFVPFPGEFNEYYPYQIPALEARATTFTGQNSIAFPGSLGAGWKELTIEAWVNNDAALAEIQAIVSAQTGEFAHFQMAAGGNNAVYVDNGNTIMLPVIPDAPTGWRHVAMVVQSGNSRIYVNGKQVGNTVTTPFSTIKPSSSVFVGKGWEGGRHFKGKIADVRIWNVARTDVDILSGMFSPPPPNTPGLVATAANKSSYSVSNFIQNLEARSQDFTGQNAIPVSGTLGSGWKELTIEAWVKNDAALSDLQAILSANSLEFAHLQLFSGGNNTVYVDDNKSITLPILSDAPNGWRHVAMAVTPGGSRIYENGIQVGNTVTTGYSTIKPSNSVFIGQGFNGGRHFKGKIAHLRIWNKYRSQQEISGDMYAGQSLLGAPGLVADYF